ncbi:hypothetical protein GOP47_0005372 [Adiantum capillus-veneris]|uniref:Secreted protein n=1 Tax=Adiantum capillus-veneris TaxID=13818 RepID=A0A9D4V644_ADICA|nr:hypothetical protein GOP47_0005372 [Adiantum capillus-veneris]
MAVCASCASLRSRPCWLIVVLSATQGRVLSRSQREGTKVQCTSTFGCRQLVSVECFPDGSVRFEERLKRHCHAAIYFCERIPLLGSIFSLVNHRATVSLEVECREPAVYTALSITANFRMMMMVPRFAEDGLIQLSASGNGCLCPLHLGVA